MAAGPRCMPRQPPTAWGSGYGVSEHDHRMVASAYQAADHRDLPVPDHFGHAAFHDGYYGRGFPAHWHWHPGERRGFPGSERDGDGRMGAGRGPGPSEMLMNAAGLAMQREEEVLPKMYTPHRHRPCK
mmetsp:Transcript_12826/g.26491  ORF Transcript_12826/g.26491 Transcript_12826/m.26491 type:complete len:128 (+) Transcript_12826:2-385(+)